MHGNVNVKLVIDELEVISNCAVPGLFIKQYIRHYKSVPT